MNALVDPGPAGSTPRVCYLYDPREIRDNRFRRRRPAVPQLELANSLSVGVGRWPTRAFVLCLLNDLENINFFSTNLQLVLSDATTTQLTFNQMTVVQTKCVSAGHENDPAAVYLVELTDRRGVLWSPWFSQPTASLYNVRAPSYDTYYYDASLNTGVAWTYNGIAGNLWNQMVSFLGSYPGLPVSVTGTPENWWFPGTPCWLALCDLLDHLGMKVTCDLTATSPYGIVQMGATDANFAALQKKYAAQMEDDWQFGGPGSGRVPGKAVVLFHRRNQYYGTEETVRKDALQWSGQTFLYPVIVNAPGAYASAAGFATIWSDFTVRYDINSTPLAADVTTANTIAAREAADYFDRIYSSTSGSMRQTYAGLLPFITGSQVSGVRWRQDFSDRERMAWITEICRNPDPPWPELGMKPSGTF